jgi:predicted small lipoprotein YifL
MTSGTAIIRTVLILGLLALTATGCGRRGALERPAGPVEPALEKADPGAVNQQAPDKRFILDGLID